MTRIGWLLTAISCLLLGVLWFFLLYSPTSDDIEQVRAETDTVLAEAALQRERAAELREVRATAPEAEAALSAGQTLIPDDASIPSLFRQMQQAADDAGVRLLTITPSPPNVVDVDDQQIATIGLSMSLEGTYFQIVDLARRIEDPLLTPRALRWTAASIGPSELPELTVSLSGEVFSRGVTDLPVAEEPEEEAPADEDVDVDVDVDAEVDTEDDTEEVS